MIPKSPPEQLSGGSIDLQRKDKETIIGSLRIVLVMDAETGFGVERYNFGNLFAEG